MQGLHTYMHGLYFNQVQAVSLRLTIKHARRTTHLATSSSYKPYKQINHARCDGVYDVYVYDTYMSLCIQYMYELQAFYMQGMCILITIWVVILYVRTMAWP